MIDLHNLIVAAVAPVKVRPALAYIDLCTATTDNEEFEVSDTAEIIAHHGNGTGVISNPSKSQISLFHLGRALTIGPWKINQLPSACDLMIFNEHELAIAELTESNPRSLIGVQDSSKPGKMEKAKSQLKSTISFINKIGLDKNQRKRTAIFFFRLPNPANSVAARSLNAFMMRPTLRVVTISTEEDCPGWQFRNHPYPFPYTLS